MKPIWRWFPWRRTQEPELPPEPEPELPRGPEPPPPETAPPVVTPSPPAEVVPAVAAEIIRAVAAEIIPAAPAPVVPPPKPAAAPPPKPAATPPPKPAPTPPSEPVEQPEARPETRPLPKAPPPAPDPEEAKAHAMARVSYFSPAGYTPGYGRSPRLLAPGRSTPLGDSAAAGVAGVGGPRSYFAKAQAAMAARAPAPPPGVLPAADPSGLALYSLVRENDPRLDPASGDRYLREPELLARAIKLRDEALDNWLAGRAPWNLAALQARAMALAGHAGTALLVCHNVARAFARGGQAIRWIKTDRLQGEYFDGARSFTARVLHREGVLCAGPFASPSIFYLLFSAQVFGAVDPGDWRRYFASAALSWYIAANAPAPASPASPFGARWAARLDSLAQAWTVSDTPAARAWAYANAASFLELAEFGRSANANRRAARVQLAGARFGCELASSAPPAGARWRIPVGTGAADLLDAAGNLVESAQPLAIPEPGTRAIRESVLEALRRAAPSAAVPVICTVEEGIACRLAPSGWRDSALQPMAETVADEIGWNVLEHAVRRQAALRVAPPSGEGGTYSCEVDLGEGYLSWGAGRNG
jgi:hypothetical protein